MKRANNVFGQVHRWQSRAVLVLSLLAALALYLSTANLGTQGRDAGYFIERALSGQTHGVAGLATAHPLHYWLSRLVLAAGVLRPSWAVTWLSGLAAATTVALLYACVARLTKSVPAGLFAAVSLALAHTFWQMATIAEVYTLTTGLLAAEVLCVIHHGQGRSWRWFGLACFLNGLGVANHLQAGLTTPLLVLLGVCSRRKGELVWFEGVLCGMAWLVGALPYTGAVAWDLVASQDVSETMRSALFGEYWTWSVLNVNLTRRVLLTAAVFPVLNFPNLLLPLAAYGLWQVRRMPVAGATRLYLVAALLIHALFAARYNVPDQYTFFLPTYMLLSLFGGLGFHELTRRSGVLVRRSTTGLAFALVALTPVWYALLPGVARQRGALNGFAKDRPCEDKYVRFLVPWSFADDAIDQVASQAFDLAGPRGVILVEDMWQHGNGVACRRIETGWDDLVLAYAQQPLSVEQRQALRQIIKHAVQTGQTVVLIPGTRDGPTVEPPIGRWRREGDVYVLETRSLHSRSHGRTARPWSHTERQRSP